MDIPTRTIFRSWNWPIGENDRFSQRPTPSHISKVSFISPGRIYRSWNTLFQNGYVRKVIFLPSESVVQKSTVIIPEGSYEDFLELKGRINDLAFVETIHFGRIYASSGSFSGIFTPGRNTISLSITEASHDEVEKISRLILGNKSKNMLISDPANSTNIERKKIRDLALVKELAYRSIYDIQISNISRKMGINLRTARRRIDRLIYEKSVFSYPLLNQVAIKGFNLFMVLINSQLDQDEFFKILNRGLLGERYLLYMVIGRMLATMFYYENLEEMDHLVSEIGKIWNNYAVITRFDSAARDP